MLTLIKNSDGETAIFFCALIQYENIAVEIAKYLIGKGAEIAIKDSERLTALHEAAKYNHVKLIEFFYGHKLDFNAVDDNAKTPLIWALSVNSQDAAKFLIENHADINAKDEKAWNAFSHYFSNRTEEVSR